MNQRNLQPWLKWPVRERLAEALLFIKETYGFESDGKTIGL
ncbi:MAG: hypothetical protein ACKOI1_06735 [Bacteroidota bacterium]